MSVLPTFVEGDWQTQSRRYHLLALNTSQPGNVNRYSLDLGELKPARQGVREDLVKWRFLEVLYDEQKEPVSQLRSNPVLLRRQRQGSRAFPQAFDLHRQELLWCLGPEPKIIPTPETRRV